MRIAILLAALMLPACTQASGPDARQTEPFAAIGPDETVRFTGTEPFWGGEVTGARLRYSTPEDIDGEEIAVERFAGNSGLSFSGRLENGALFDLMITQGTCSDGMSDRSYPFVATLKLGGSEIRSGCAWTAARPFEGPENP